MAVSHACFGKKELKEVRVTSTVRRSNEFFNVGGCEDGWLTVGPLGIHFESRRVTRDGRFLELQPAEYKIPEYMMRNAGITVTRPILFEEIPAPISLRYTSRGSERRSSARANRPSSGPCADRVTCSDMVLLGYGVALKC